MVLPRDTRTRSKTILKELARYAGFPFQPAVPDLDAWAHAVINERDNAAHNKGRPLYKPALATQLVESVYFLVLVGLLRRAEAPDTAFVALRNSQPFLWPMTDIFREFGGEDWLLAMGKSSGRLGG